MTNRTSNSGSGGTRRDRREAARKDARLKAAATTQPQPFWKSSVFLMTLGAVAVAAVIIGFAVLSSRGSGGGSSSTISAPLVFTPTAGADGAAIGPADAKVKVEIWSDFQCPACDAFAKSTLIDLVKKYEPTGDVRFEDRALWFIGAGQNEDSLNAGAAAECAAEQNQYWPYHDYLFANQGKENSGWPNRALLDGIAAKVSLDTAAFAQCYDGGTQHATVKDNTALAAKVPVSGTPTIVINGVPYESRYVPTADQLSAEIDKALAAAGGSTAPSASPAGSPSASTAP
jgi:protein-disulfide isomerase